MIFVHLTQIQYFLTVVKTKSISNAAESLFVSQSAVSKQILLLEKELGFQLFDRGFRQIRLTENGRMLYQCLTRCSTDFSNTLDAIRRSGSGQSSLLRVGFVEYWDPMRLRESIERHFESIGEEIHLSLEPYWVSELTDVLRRGNIDMVLSFDSAFANRENVTVVPLGNLACGMLYAKERFPVKERAKVRADFSGVPVLETDDTSHPYRQELRAIMEKYGFNNPMISCPRFSSMLARIMSGQGIFMVSDWTYLRGNDKLGYYSLGKDLPVSAAYTQDAVSQGKLPLIRHVIGAIEQDLAKE